MMLLVKCPKCLHDQKCAPKESVDSFLSSKVKRCVYCGKSFKIHSNIKDSRIIKKIS